ncbi:LemA family protein [Sulfurovum sp. zt1-1]|uniref:LemA family protein n=1 Tax=Sulfurovum zhangzhouensis TaxID=3019067 RepID=A0ABT7QV43_9BACT|nr:LemA family protein [Sulfurovum zhangzhouensis]MDM5270658.1 LemA family protein [Sulfurovum zhangzhouensis]
MSFGNIILLIIVGVIGYLIAIYNKFVSLRAGIDAAWSDIDIQLKRRYNLIPALVDTVKGYKEYEAGTLEKVIQARQAGLDARSIEEKAAAANMLTGTLGKLFALAEAYPDLKANTNFLDLQNQLSHIEDTIQNARRYYNAIVRDYNTKVHSFPDLFIAQKFNFTERDYFELDENEAAAVKTMPKIDL